jgi:hypothetical protein
LATQEQAVDALAYSALRDAQDASDLDIGSPPILTEQIDDLSIGLVHDLASLTL